MVNPNRVVPCAEAKPPEAVRQGFFQGRVRTGQPGRGSFQEQRSNGSHRRLGAAANRDRSPA